MCKNLPHPDLSEPFIITNPLFLVCIKLVSIRNELKSSDELNRVSSNKMLDV